MVFFSSIAIVAFQRSRFNRAKIMKTPAKIAIQAWQSPGILLEHYRYTAGTVKPLLKHSHAQYQFGLSFDCQGEYYYRGSYHSIPIGSLSMIHSGEVHAPSERTYLPTPVTFLMMHVEPSLLQTAASEMAQKPVSLPFFPQPFISDHQTIHLFENLSVALTTKATQLQQDLVLLKLFTCLITGYAEKHPLICSLKSKKSAIAQVCDFLQVHYADPVSLDQLANIAGLSRFYLCRLFRREIGLSLSAYQMQIRIDRAKQLLAKGIPIAQVASEIGFYDQSHFGYHFKRLVGTTPGNYQQ